MNVNIQTVHFDADTKLVSYIEKKLSKLFQYHDRIVKVDVYLKLDNVVHNIKDKAPWSGRNNSRESQVFA